MMSPDTCKRCSRLLMRAPCAGTTERSRGKRCPPVLGESRDVPGLRAELTTRRGDGTFSRCDWVRRLRLLQGLWALPQTPFLPAQIWATVSVALPRDLRRRPRDREATDFAIQRLASSGNPALRGECYAARFPRRAVGRRVSPSSATEVVLARSIEAHGGGAQPAKKSSASSASKLVSPTAGRARSTSSTASSKASFHPRFLSSSR